MSSNDPFGSADGLNSPVEDPGDRQMVHAFEKEIEFLRCIPMFSCLKDVELARLCQIATFRSYHAGDVLLEEGRTNDLLFMIRRGSVELISQRTGAEPFLQLDRGRFFGQVSMFNPAPASATVRARETVEVMCLRERPLRDLLIAYPEVGVRLMAAIVGDLAKRYHSLVRRLRDLAPDNGESEHDL